MVWRILVAVAALAIFSGGDACAQATNGVPPDHAAPDQPQIVVECIAIRELHEKIIVGRRGKGIILWLGGGACNAPGSSGISDLSAGFATDGGMEDVVEGENCPAFQKRINKLWAARQHTQHGYGTIPDVRAGPLHHHRYERSLSASKSGRPPSCRPMDQSGPGCRSTVLGHHQGRPYALCRRSPLQRPSKERPSSNRCGCRPGCAAGIQTAARAKPGSSS